MEVKTDWKGHIGANISANPGYSDHSYGRVAEQGDSEAEVDDEILFGQMRHVLPVDSLQGNSGISTIMTEDLQGEFNQIKDSCAHRRLPQI